MFPACRKMLFHDKNIRLAHEDYVGKGRVPHSCVFCKGAVFELSRYHPSDFFLDYIQELRFNPAHANARLVRFDAP